MWFTYSHVTSAAVVLFAGGRFYFATLLTSRLLLPRMRCCLPKTIDNQSLLLATLSICFTTSPVISASSVLLAGGRFYFAALFAPRRLLPRMLVCLLKATVNQSLLLATSSIYLTTTLVISASSVLLAGDAPLFCHPSRLETPTYKNASLPVKRNF